MLLTHYAARALNEAYSETRLIQDGAEILIQFNNTNISTLRGEVAVERLRVRNLDSGDEFRARTLSIFVSHRDLLNLAMSRGSGERPALTDGRVELRDIAVLNAEQEMRYTAAVIDASVSGDLFEMYAFVRTDFRNTPDRSHDIRIRMNDLRPGTEPLPFIPAALPISRLDRLVLNMNYDHLADAFQVSQFEISVGADRIRLDGRLTDVSAISALGSDAEAAETFVRPVLTANMRITPVRPQIPIGNDGMAVHFRSFDASFEGPLTGGLSPQVLLQTEFSEVHFDIEELSIFPPETFTETFGQPLGFLGVSSDRFFVPGLNAAYRITDNVATISRFNIGNPFAEVGISGQLLRDSGTGMWQWDDACLNIRSITEEAESFIRMMTSFFNLRLPQTDGAFSIPITGPLQSPRLQGLNL